MFYSAMIVRAHSLHAIFCIRSRLDLDERRLRIIGARTTQPKSGQLLTNGDNIGVSFLGALVATFRESNYCYATHPLSRSAPTDDSF
eukprot:COSAG02_NODE_3354_length_6883_cov_188.063237_7_plen_87_part_00